jgi:dual specificity protein kinase YAK1
LVNDPARCHFEKRHLINMQDYFVFKDFLCIVFECLDKSLYDIILETEKGLPLAQVREYVHQMLEALVTFKDANLIHCDLKPENILTTADKNLKLIDFGSAAFNGH